MNTLDRPPTQQVLRAFSSCLLALGDVTHAAGVDHILEDAMRTFQPLVRFDRAWWGQVAGGAPEEARNWLQGHIGLSPRFGEEWNRIAPRDAFGQGSMHGLGRVIRSVDGEEQPIPAEIFAFCERWDLRHAMAITVELPGSGQLFFISLYRGLGADGFDDEEAGLFAEFSTHLLQGWRQRLSALQARLGTASWDSFAVADAQGRLLYLGRRAAAELKRAFPDWPGWVLPSALGASLTEPEAPARVPSSMTVQRVGALITIACARKAARRAGLAPSQWNAAVLYAQGQAHTAIAQRLGLTPATVRTYLRNAYAQLGVRNKIELAAALNDAADR
ncbi:helix-turn-helix transcriptional regulator [Sphaerotilaceae bacterium SBD11-9]